MKYETKNYVGFKVDELTVELIRPEVSGNGDHTEYKEILDNFDFSIVSFGIYKNMKKMVSFI